MTELHAVYVYALAHLSRLGERSALKVKRLFPTYDSWVGTTLADRRRMIDEVVGQRFPSTVPTNWDELMEQARREIHRHESDGIFVLTIDDSAYPVLLRAIPDPPLVLFVKGSIKSLTQYTNVAIVGTRDSTSKGEEVATRIARLFGTHQFGIVSGLAKGIDTAAHKGALESNAPTIAVFATPLNKVYPAENKPLAEAILKMNGSWISEIPLSKKPHRSSFVQRDRIQSGISVAVIPVQTDIQGGTMHTVEYAEQQNRLLLCPRPLNGEQHLKQYAGIAALIESKRATPFQSDDYLAVLDRVRIHAGSLKEAAKPHGAEVPRSTPTTRAKQPVQPAEPSKSSGQTILQEQTIQRLLDTFNALGLARSQSEFDEAIDVLRQKLYGRRRRSAKPELKLKADLDKQIFKARLSKPIDQALFTEKWREHFGGADVRFRIKGTDLTATQTRTLWDSSTSPDCGAFFNVLQNVLHDIARDCTVLDCEEITNVNA